MSRRPRRKRWPKTDPPWAVCRLMHDPSADSECVADLNLDEVRASRPPTRVEARALEDHRAFNRALARARVPCIGVTPTNEDSGMARLLTEVRRAFEAQGMPAGAGTEAAEAIIRAAASLPRHNRIIWRTDDAPPEE